MRAWYLDPDLPVSQSELKEGVRRARAELLSQDPEALLNSDEQVLEEMNLLRSLGLTSLLTSAVRQLVYEPPEPLRFPEWMGTVRPPDWDRYRHLLEEGLSPDQAWEAAEAARANGEADWVQADPDDHILQARRDDGAVMKGRWTLRTPGAEVEVMFETLHNRCWEARVTWKAPRPRPEDPFCVNFQGREGQEEGWELLRAHLCQRLAERYHDLISTREAEAARLLEEVAYLKGSVPAFVKPAFAEPGEDQDHHA